MKILMTLFEAIVHDLTQMCTLSLKWEVKLRHDFQSKRKCCLWRWRYHDTMIWLIPVKAMTTLYDLVQQKAGIALHINCSHIVLPDLKNGTAELAFAWAHSSSKMAPDHYQDSAFYCLLTSNRGMKALLCSALVFHPQPDSQNQMFSLYITRTPSNRYCLWKSLFPQRDSPEWELRGCKCGAVWGKHAASCRVAQFSVLDSLFCLPLSFLSLPWASGPARSLLH